MTNYAERGAAFANSAGTKHEPASLKREMPDGEPVVQKRNYVIISDVSEGTDRDISDKEGGRERTYQILSASGQVGFDKYSFKRTYHGVQGENIEADKKLLESCKSQNTCTITFYPAQKAAVINNTKSNRRISMNYEVR